MSANVFCCCFKLKRKENRLSSSNFVLTTKKSVWFLIISRSNEKNIRVAEIGVDLRIQELRKNSDKGKKGSPDTH